MKTVVALPGEGIGPEVVAATCELLLGTGLPLKILTPPQGAAAVKSHGEALPEETKRAGIAADGVLFGAAGPTTSLAVTWLRWEISAWGARGPEVVGSTEKRSWLPRSRRLHVRAPPIQVIGSMGSMGVLSPRLLR